MQAEPSTSLWTQAASRTLTTNQPSVTADVLGSACIFEGEEAPFPQLGYTIAVLEPGQSGGRYHREANQEDFLVLSGECLVIVEGEERHLKVWDYVQCTAHA